MNTVRKIDLHTHILPPKWTDLREKFGGDRWVRLEEIDPCSARMMVGDRHFRDIKHNCWDPLVRIDDCDKCGVAMQVLSTVPVMFSYWAKPDQALHLSQILNDHISGIVRQHPTRFAGLGTVPMQSPSHAIKELERCVRDLNLSGIEIGTNVNGVNLDDPGVFDVLAAAQDLNAAVFVHPWEMLGKDRMSKYWLPWLVGMPAETSLAICSVIFSGVLERLPKLRICFAHGGGAFPFTIGRICHGYKTRPDLCAVDNDVDPRRYVGKFYLDSLVHDADALRYLINLMGDNRIAMGSDYPFPLGEECPGQLIEQMELSPATKEQLLSRTALEFLNRGMGVSPVRPENAGETPTPR
ncbi:MAG: amidohydrolase [Anaerolineae bacterium]|nr:amidohydrolase [Phycisphaerae bacterium]